MSDDDLRTYLRALHDPERWENTLDDAWPREGGRSHIVRVLAQEVVAVIDAHEPATEPRHEGCDCTELCSMGPTCPGGMLAGLPSSGCWRTRPFIEDVLNAHAGTTSGGDKRHVYCRPECGWTGNDWVQHRAHVAQAIREARAR